MNKIVGTSWTLASKPHQIFQNNDSDEKFTANICIFQIPFSQWRAQVIKNLFWSFFQEKVPFTCVQNFNSVSHPLQVFCKNIQYFASLRCKHDFSRKIFAVFYQYTEKKLDFVEKWEKFSHLLLKIFSLAYFNG